MVAEKPKLYALSTCFICAQTATLLNKCDVEYDYIEVDCLEGEERKATLEAVKQLNPQRSFPTTKINNTVIIGFQEDKIREALGVKNEN